MIDAIKSKELLIGELCRKHGVSRLELVGSGARDADFNPLSSDADFLVLFPHDGEIGTLKSFFDFQDALAELIGLPVDLVEAGSVLNPYIAAQFNADRELVYAA